MPIELPDLPYALDSLAPIISKETLEYHYGKHHRGYVNKLNGQIAGTEFEHADLEDIIKRSSGGMFNNAAQVWNHSFYWHCLAPDGGGEPESALADALTRAFGSVDGFRKQFTEAASGVFGSGWAWLVQSANGDLKITTTPNAQTPLTSTDRPLLTCDVWEHAYYIDYRNARGDYLQAFWQRVNWRHAAAEMQ